MSVIHLATGVAFKLFTKVGILKGVVVVAVLTTQPVSEAVVVIQTSETESGAEAFVIVLVGVTAMEGVGMVTEAIVAVIVAFAFKDDTVVVFEAMVTCASIVTTDVAVFMVAVAVVTIVVVTGANVIAAVVVMDTGGAQGTEDEGECMIVL